MLAVALCAALSLGAPESVTGKIRVTGTSFKRTVSVVAGDQPIELKGDLVAELERLGSITVEVVGNRDGEDLLVAQYRIVDIGGGVAPVVGTLVEVATGLALSDGKGDPIPLNLPARARRRLAAQIGAKVWVAGKSLLSGELEVRRFGVLRDAPKAAPPAPPPPEGTPPQD